MEFSPLLKLAVTNLVQDVETNAGRAPPPTPFVAQDTTASTNMASEEQGIRNSSEQPEDSDATKSGNPSGNPRGRNIEDCIADLLSTPISGFARLDERHGDTWIFISPPAREPEHSDKIYAAIKNYYKKPFRARSWVLKASKSEIILKQLENPTRQFRIIRRFGVKHLMQENGIEYVIDLTPPVEGDEAVEITSELSCPPGILNWYQESDMYGVSNTLVAGMSEFMFDKYPFPSQNVRSKENQPDISDYSPVRHCASIERVLLALHGRDPQIDSAPKMYTTVMTATKHLRIPAHCLTHNLTGFVATWLRAVPNNVFIELYPDITLKIADCLEVAPLCQDAFAILVGEEVLEMASQHNPALRKQNDRTIFSRLRSSVGEVWDTRIQYARNAMAERIEKLFFRDLVGDEMKWVEQLSSVMAVPKLPDAQYMIIYNDWLQTIKSYARGAIYHMLLGEYLKTPLLDYWNHQDDRTVRKIGEFANTFRLLRCKERVLTQDYWLAMKCLHFKDEHFTKNVDVKPTPGCEIKNGGFDYDDSEYRAFIEAGIFKAIPRTEIHYLSQDLHNRSIYLVGTQGRAVLEKKWDNKILNSTAARDSVASRPPCDKKALPIRSGQTPNELRVVNASESGEDTLSQSYESVKIHLPENSSGGAPRIPTIVTVKEEPVYIVTEEALFEVAPYSKAASIVADIEGYLAHFALQMLRQPNSGSLEAKQINTLLCLNESELRYLPLWAGGVDDGSNGVFGEDLPAIPEEYSFGPAREGLRRILNTEGMEFDDVSTTVGAPTIATSRMVNDGKSVIMDRRQVYAEDEVESTKCPYTNSDAGTESDWQSVGGDTMSVQNAELPTKENSWTTSTANDSIAESEDSNLPTNQGEENCSEMFFASDSDDDDIDNEMVEDACSDTPEDMGFDFVEDESLESSKKSVQKKSTSETAKSMVAEWVASNPKEAESVIHYRERSQSPLVFEKS